RWLRPSAVRGGPVRRGRGAGARLERRRHRLLGGADAELTVEDPGGELHRGGIRERKQRPGGPGRDAAGRRGALHRGGGGWGGRGRGGRGLGTAGGGGRRRRAMASWLRPKASARREKASASSRGPRSARWRFSTRASSSPWRADSAAGRTTAGIEVRPAWR